jgi:hypothetical protein
MTKFFSWENVSGVFQFACSIGAVSLLLWCIWEYSKDEDIVEVAFKKYGTDDQSMYPDISLCFELPYDDEKLKAYGKEITSSLYTMFLMGTEYMGHWDERVVNIDYENVSVQLQNHIIGSATVSSSKFLDISKNNTSIEKLYSYGFPTFKCFTFNLPKRTKIITVAVAIKNSVFSSGIRPKKGFEVMLHYPQQRLRSWEFVLKNWPRRTNTSSKSYQLDVNVKDIEILKRRNRYAKQCININSYDNLTAEEIMQSVGCRPPYWNTKGSAGLPACTTRLELQGISSLFYNALEGTGEYENPIPPCNEITKIGVDFVETDFDINQFRDLSGGDIDLDYTTIGEAWTANG